MRQLTQSGVGCQKAPISHAAVKSQVRFAGIFLAIMLMVIAGGLAGCAGLTGAAPNGNQGDPKTPILSMGSNAIAFGNVAVGTTATQTLTVTNTGTAAANISQATISGTGFTVTGAVPSGSIAIGQALTVQIQFAPQSTGAANGSFSLTSDASNSPAAASLTGMGTEAGLTVSPTSLNFGTVDVGTNATKNVTLTNAGSASVTISSITPTGQGISVSGLSLPATVNAGANAMFTVQFTPSASGSASGSISIASTAPTSPITVAVSGTGAGPQIVANPASVNFGNVVDGNTGSQIIQISNNGSAALTISQVSMTAGNNGFGLSGISTPLVIQAGKSASFNALFEPSNTGSVSGTISLSSNAPNSPLTINLTGTGGPITRTLTASTTTVSFGNVKDGTTATQNVTLTNTGNSNILISAISANGTGFGESGVNGGTTLTPNQTATLTVSFDPSSPGPQNGGVTVNSNASNSPMMIAASGTGTAPEAQIAANPASVSFGNVVDGNTNSQTIQISNSGSATLTISQVSMTGGNNGFGLSGISTPLVIQAGKSATFNALFGPSNTGNVSGTISLVSNAPNSPLTINLTGTGVAITRTLTVSTTTVAFGNVNDGTTTTQNVTLTNTGNSSVLISTVTANGTAFGDSGVNGGTTLTPNQTAALTVSFDPSNPGAQNGGVTVNSNASNSPILITLSGTGVQSTQHSVGLGWTASTTTGVVGYYVYRGTQSGNYTKISGQIASTSYTDTSVTSGQNITYYYVVTAVDGSGTESTDSNQATATVP